MTAWTHRLEQWHEWYMLVGTAAATLVALTFVVVALGPNVVRRQTETGVRAFFTPIVALLSSVLLVSLCMLVPGVTPVALGSALTILGAGGLVYLIVIKVHQRWAANKLGLDDWVWFLGLPLLSYALTLVAGILIVLHRSGGLIMAAAAMTLMLVTGIRNAWDVVLWVAQQPERE